jgi:hypothetical protein
LCIYKFEKWANLIYNSYHYIIPNLKSIQNRDKYTFIKQFAKNDKSEKINMDNKYKIIRSKFINKNKYGKKHT